jgi:hypothetical protein
MIVRSNNSSLNETERKEASLKSLDLAKKAINYDLKDSESWCKR